MYGAIKENVGVSRSKFDREEMAKDSNETSLFENNQYIKAGVEMVNKEKTNDALFLLLQVLIKRMLEDGQAPTPMVDINNVMEMVKVDELQVGDTFTLEEDMKLTIAMVEDQEGKVWIPLYTDKEELEKSASGGVFMNLRIEDIIRDACFYDGACGLVINPFGESLSISKEILQIVFETYEEGSV